MATIIGKIVDWIFGKNQRQRENSLFYLKSLLFLTLIVISISDKFWQMSSSIKKLLGVNVGFYILEISNIGIHFFTSLAIISFVIVIISAIICEITRRVICFEKYENYFNRMRIGAEFRLSYSVEDVLLLLMTAYIFDTNVIQNYISVYSDYIVIGLGVICAFQFFTSSVAGIFNRFLMLNLPYDEKEQ